MATRTETVRLTLDDAGFTSGMARAAASAAVVRNALEDLDGTNVNVSRGTRDLSANLDAAGDSARSTSADIDGIGKSTQGAGKEIDRLSGRLRLFTDLALVLGPGLVPIGAVAVPAVATLAAGLGAAALAAGAAVVAFQGVGEATKAIDEYNLDASAANLEKMDAAMAQLAPSAAAFTLAFQDFQPVLGDIQKAAANGIFPGLTESLDNFEKVGPQVAAIFREVGKATGESVRDFSAELAGPQYEDFLGFLRTAAPAAISSMGRSLADLTHGVTELMMNLNPGIQGGFGWIEDVANGFDSWASSAQGASAIEDILAYVRETGPQVGALISSLGSALAGLARAAAPLGGPVLSSLTGLLDAFAALANSPIGTPLLAAATAMATLSRASKLGGFAVGSIGTALGKAGTDATRFQTAMGKVGSAVNVAGLALAGFSVASALQNDFHGLESGVGAVTRGLTDLSGVTKGAGLPAEFDDINSSFERLTDPGKVLKFQDSLESMSVAGIELGSILGRQDEGEKARAQFESIDQALSGLVQTAGSDQGLAAFSSLVKSMGLTGSEVDNLLGMLPQYKDALAESGSSADAASSSSERLAASQRAEAAAISQAASAMRDKVSATIGAFDAETGYREALKAAREQADNNSKGINGMSDAALKNRSALSGLASAWSNQSAAVRNNSKRYGEAREAFIQVAQGMGLTRQRANQLANSMLQIPTGTVKKLANDLRSLPRNVRTDIQANGLPKTRADVMDLARKYNLTPKQVRTLMSVTAGGAMLTAKQLQSLLRTVGGMKPKPTIGVNDLASGPIGGIIAAIGRVTGKTVTITTVHRDVRVGSTAGIAANPTLNADGGYISGPGGPRDDLIPAMLSNGEFVINAAATRANLPLLEQINSRKFADGGHVTNNIQNFAEGGRASGRVALPGFGDFDRAANRAARSTDKMSDSQDRNRKRDDNSLKARIKATEKEVEARKKIVEALKATRDEVVSSVKERFSSDLFAKPESQSVLPEDFATLDPAAQRAWLNVQSQADARNTASPADVLRRDIAGLGQFNNIRASLQGAGLRGPALSELLRNAPMEQLQAYAFGPRSELRQFASLYTQRQQALGSVSGAAGNAVVPELKRALRVQIEANQHLLELNQAMKRQEKADDRREKKADDSPRKTGEAVGKAINNAAVAGRRRTAGP